jgi:hypothetical protein
MPGSSDSTDSAATEQIGSGDSGDGGDSPQNSSRKCLRCHRWHSSLDCLKRNDDVKYRGGLIVAQRVDWEVETAVTAVTGPLCPTQPNLSTVSSNPIRNRWAANGPRTVPVFRVSPAWRFNFFLVCPKGGLKGESETNGPNLPEANLECKADLIRPYLDLLCKCHEPNGGN